MVSALDFTDLINTSRRHALPPLCLLGAAAHSLPGAAAFSERRQLLSVSGISLVSYLDLASDWTSCPGHYNFTLLLPLNMNIKCKRSNAPN